MPGKSASRVMGDPEDRARVFIQLSEDQVERVIASASPDGEAVDFSRVSQTSAHGARVEWIFSSLMEDRGLSHSLLIGLQVLSCFPLDGTERGVADIARQLGMNNSTVHRYMTTLTRVGLLERNPYTRWYRLRHAEVPDLAD
jgi:hypothetical protein